MVASVGVSVAVNTISNTTRSYISGSDVTSSGAITLKASTDANIFALAMAGSFGGAGAAGGGVVVLGAGSISINTIANRVEAYISAGSVVTTTGTGAISLFAGDDTDIQANAGAVAIGGAGGAVGGVVIPIGASSSVNTVANWLRAYILASTVDSAGDVNLTARSDAKIWALSMAGAGGGAGGAGGGVVISGAG